MKTGHADPENRVHKLDYPSEMDEICFSIPIIPSAVHVMVAEEKCDN